MITDSHTMGVLPKIFDPEASGLSVAKGRFTIDHPWLFPCIIYEGLILCYLVTLAELKFKFLEQNTPERGTKHPHRIKVFAIFCNAF